MKRSGERRGGRLRGETGQATVEFALVLPVLLLLVCGIIDFGWIYSNKLAADNACREAARYIAIHYSTYAAPQLTPATADARNIVKTALTGSYYNAASPPTVTVTNPDAASVKVTLTYSVPVLTGVTSAVIGKTVSMNISSTMAVEQ